MIRSVECRFYRAKKTRNCHAKEKRIPALPRERTLIDLNVSRLGQKIGVTLCFQHKKNRKMKKQFQ